MSVTINNATPSKPAYFEFLLQPSMLKEHLNQTDPGLCDL